MRPLLTAKRGNISAKNVHFFLYSPALSSSLAAAAFDVPHLRIRIASSRAWIVRRIRDIHLHFHSCIPMYAASVVQYSNFPASSP